MLILNYFTINLITAMQIHHSKDLTERKAKRDKRDPIQINEKNIVLKFIEGKACEIF